MVGRWATWRESCAAEWTRWPNEPDRFWTAVFRLWGCAGYELGRFRLAQAAEREDSEHRERAPPVAQVCLIGPCDRGRRSTFLSGGTLK